MIEQILSTLKQIGYSNVKQIAQNTKLNYTDTMLVASAKNESENRAFYEAFLEFVNQNKIPVKHIEGVKRCEWIIVDCDKLVIHLFAKEFRDKFNIDKLHK